LSFRIQSSIASLVNDGHHRRTFGQEKCWRASTNFLLHPKNKMGIINRNKCEERMKKRQKLASQSEQRCGDKHDEIRYPGNSPFFWIA
jgi:hypothetical protein